MPFRHAAILAGFHIFNIIRTVDTIIRNQMLSHNFFFTYKNYLTHLLHGTTESVCTPIIYYNLDPSNMAAWRNGIASDYESGDCRFDPCCGHILFFLSTEASPDTWMLSAVAHLEASVVDDLRPCSQLDSYAMESFECVYSILLEYLHRYQKPGSNLGHLVLSRRFGLCRKELE
jgi:hypothetical protein